MSSGRCCPQRRARDPLHGHPRAYPGPAAWPAIAGAVLRLQSVRVLAGMNVTLVDSFASFLPGHSATLVVGPALLVLGFGFFVPAAHAAAGPLRPARARRQPTARAAAAAWGQWRWRWRAASARRRVQLSPVGSAASSGRSSPGPEPSAAYAARTDRVRLNLPRERTAPERTGPAGTPLPGPLRSVSYKKRAEEEEEKEKEIFIRVGLWAQVPHLSHPWNFRRGECGVSVQPALAA